MQFLKTIFWVILAVVAVVFSFGNWTQVTLQLWGDVQVDAKLPVLLFIAFLLGLLPTLALYRATRWRLRKRLETTERALNELRGVPPTPELQRESVPPGSIPTAVPPGVA
jgi:lipopolysaccharide assembly protein A